MDEELERLMQEASAEIEETESERDDNETNEDDINEEQHSSTGIDEKSGDETEDGENDSGERNDEKNAESETNNENDEDSGINNEEEENPNDRGESSLTNLEIEIDGAKIEFSSAEEIKDFIERNIKQKDIPLPSRNEQILSSKNISEDELMLLAEVKAGNPKALALFAKQNNIDIEQIDADDANDFKQEQTFEEMNETEGVAYQIYNDSNLKDKFQETIKETSQDFIQVISQDASSLRNFAEHVKTGLAQEIIPKAKAEVLKNGGTFFDAYAKIGQELYNAKNKTKDNTEVKKDKNERKISEKEKELRKKANKNKDNSKTNPKNDSAEDVWNLSDEEFRKKYA